MQELKEKAINLEITIKNRWDPISIEDLINKEQAIDEYVKTKSKLACIKFYS